MKTKNKQLLGIGIIVMLAVISVLIALFSSLTYLESFRIIFGSIYVLFFAGFCVELHIFFQTTKILKTRNFWVQKIQTKKRFSLRSLRARVNEVNVRDKKPLPNCRHNFYKTII